MTVATASWLRHENVFLAQTFRYGRRPALAVAVDALARVLRPPVQSCDRPRGAIPARGSNVTVVTDTDVSINTGERALLVVISVAVAFWAAVVAAVAWLLVT